MVAIFKIYRLGISEMSVSSVMEKICTKLGTNNKPTYVVMAIATVKGICRPVFTMMDKKENPETKKYTAIREGLTEIIAIPVYWASGELAGKLAHVLAKPKNFMDKNLYKQHKKGHVTPEVAKAFDSAKELAENNLSKMNKNLMFIGVCTAALFVIPALCSVAIKPLMGVIQKNHKPEDKRLDVNTLRETSAPLYNPYFQHNDNLKYLSSFNKTPVGGMKVGGV